MAIRIIFKDIISKIGFAPDKNSAKPIEIAVEITDRCNLDCPFCFNKVFEKNNKREELDYASIKDIIDNISEFGVKRIRFSGGEPLLREDLYDLMAYAKSKGLKIWLNTNATLVDEKKSSRLGQFVDNVLVPLSSFDLASEFSATKKYLFESKLAGIRLLKEANIKVVRIGTVTTKSNIQNLERIYDMVNGLKITDWQLFRVIPNRSNLFPISNEDVANLVETLIKINKKGNVGYKITNAIPFCAYEPKKISEIAVGGKYSDGHTRLIVDGQGVVRPMYYMEEKIGDALMNKDFNRLWNHKFMRDMRNLKFAPGICKKCIYLNTCLGGSRAVSKIINNSYTQLDYLAQPLKYKDQLFNS